MSEFTDPEAALERARHDLAERRNRGELPAFPAGELRSHFEGVVESVEAGLVSEPPIDIAALVRATEMSEAIPTDSDLPGGSVLHRIVAKVNRRSTVAVLEQVSQFAQVTTRAIDELADRQRRLQEFLLGAHLDRVRSLERRVAQLELELERLDRTRD